MDGRESLSSNRIGLIMTVTPAEIIASRLETPPRRITPDEVRTRRRPDLLRLQRKYEGLPLPIAEYGDIHSVAWKTVGHAVRQDRPLGDETGLPIEVDDDIPLLKNGLQCGPVQPVLAAANAFGRSL